ncbi:MAG: helix-turn-helix domain-containing protein [Acidimicrobiaceae bacterium]|nr:helix-turn-helix domain-containing protein [Acidimicrobiaceae bacterium]
MILSAVTVPTLPPSHRGVGETIVSPDSERVDIGSGTVTASAGDEEAETARAVARAVGTVVGSLRDQRGWSLAELADEAGKHRTHLGLVERGERRVSVESAYRLARALGLSLTELVNMAEAQAAGADLPIRLPARMPPPDAARNADRISAISGLGDGWITGAIANTYRRLDLIDEQLVNAGAQPLAETVELASLSAMIGNLLRSALADGSEGRYRSNDPHKYPDLVSESDAASDLEIKIALETNQPKGHLPKPGHHLVFRYVLGNRRGEYVRRERGNVAWIWEARLGHLSALDFSESNTSGDSGKTAVVKARVLNEMTCIYYDRRFLPYARPRPGHE